MGTMFNFIEAPAANAVIKVIGIGGGGNNAVNHMVNANIEGVEFIVANTDSQAIAQSPAKQVLQLGAHVTKGLGAGANPEVGRQAALEDRERICEVLRGSDMVFIAAGMGGGTGTGAAPIVAQLAREMGILTVAVVTKPFPFEGRRRLQVAMKGIDELSNHVDSLITIPNERLLTVLGREANFLTAFRAADDVLRGAVQGIADLITRPGLINVDFADVRTVMSEMGLAMMGTGTGRGDDRALAAAEAAISNPLLDEVNLTGACGILVNITAGPNFSMREYEEIGRTVDGFASEDANIVIGTVLDPSLQEEIRVTVVATGLNRNSAVRVASVARDSVSHGERPVGVRLVSQPSANAAEAAPRVPVRPSFVRGGGSAAVALQPEPMPEATQRSEDDYLNIPAFLRRQAD
jgi:cell division protein FtsZ